MIRPLMLLPPAVFAGFVLLAGVGMFRDDPDALPSTLVGRTAPAVTANPVGDLPVFTQEALMAPGVKLVNFWASWCAPCRAEHPVLVGLSKEFPIYGVNRDLKVDDALGFLAELGNPFTAMVFDDRNRQSIDWGVYGLPETFVIDGTGKVVLRYAGPITPTVLESTIRPALAAAAETDQARMQ